MGNSSETEVLVLGVEGYIGKVLSCTQGWPGVDNMARQRLVAEVGSESLIPQACGDDCIHGDVTDYEFLRLTLETFRPKAVVHLAELPSAPYSMSSPQNAARTQTNNLASTLAVLYAIRDVDPGIHLVKLGTAGSYCANIYDGVQVPEGPRVQVQFRGRDWSIPTPRFATDWYHLSKAYDSLNIDLACQMWGLRATDLDQGIVYGHVAGTRFDYDQCFGTVVNRFVVQAVAGMPVTVYGSGSQCRPFIHLMNVVDAIRLTVENPPEQGEYRVFHQLTESVRINTIAEHVARITGADIEHIPNPRYEQDCSELSFEARRLIDFGLEPRTMKDELQHLVDTVRLYKHNIRKQVIAPTYNWCAGAKSPVPVA